MANTTVTLYKRIDGKFHTVEFHKNGSIKADGSNGSFYLSWYEGQKLVWKSVGKDATHARARRDAKSLEMRVTSDAKTAGISLVGSPNVSKSALSKLTIKAAIDSYLQKITDGKDYKTLLAYENDLKYFASYCQAADLKLLEEVTSENLLKFAVYLRGQGLGPRTVSNKFRSVRTFLSRSTSHVSIISQDLPKYTKKRPQVNLVEDLKALFAVCNPQEELLFRFLLGTGFREGEVMHAEWNNINWDSSYVTVRDNQKYGWKPKAGKDRHVPISQSLLDALKAAKETSTNSLIFPAENGRPNKHFLRLLKVLAVKAGLDPENFRLHKLRSTFATYHLRNGVDIATVSFWMGHANLGATQRYLAPVSGPMIQAKVDSTFAGI